MSLWIIVKFLWISAVLTLEKFFHANSRTSVHERWPVTIRAHDLHMGRARPGLSSRSIEMVSLQPALKPRLFTARGRNSLPARHALKISTSPDLHSPPPPRTIASPWGRQGGLREVCPQGAPLHWQTRILGCTVLGVALCKERAQGVHLPVWGRSTRICPVLGATPRPRFRSVLTGQANPFIIHL